MGTLLLTSPTTKGEAVKRLQRAINQHLKNHGSTLVILVDGEYGPATQAAEAHCAWLLGASHPHDWKRAQAIIMRPAIRTPREFAWGRKHTAIERKRVTRGPAGAVLLAHKLANTIPHYTENPAGSNGDKGGIIDQAQKEVGIFHDFYCGAGVHYMVLHGGGVNLTSDVRYCPSIEGHAKAGTGGLLKWMPVSQKKQWRAGDILTFDEGGVAGHTELLVNTARIATHNEVVDVGWNTGSGPGGSQSNGGGIFPRTRPIDNSEGFPVRGAARVRWH